MLTMQKTLTALTAADVMTSPVEVVPQDTTLRAAAALLRQADISGAPVVDEQGRCVGVLSAVDFLRRAAWPSESGGPCPQINTCSYQKPVLNAGATEAVLCTYPEGKCPLQVPGSTLDGEEGQFCLLPHCVLLDWQQVIEQVPTAEVRHFMTPDVVTVGPRTPLTDVAQMMMDAHIHRVIVADKEGRPVGIVTSTDILAAVARLGRRR
jgi:CBS domain-containing protein